MENLLRQILKRTTARTVLRTTLNGLGLFCACTFIWEHLVTVQLSEGPSMGIAVGDVVRFYHPTFLGVHGAKRVIGMPGDFVCRDLAFSVDVPEGHVYLAGDNLPWSRDSRNYGPIPMALINGKIIARVWPPSKMQWVENTLQPAQDVSQE
ncbi:hypothetical protein ARAM_006903 [Aspergillus rambellii]|uniref:Peptidase S26 domain-containing protein n=1 Tax=Aspergillus rambellii TaxID=308745 RepID=A0A0F8X066_9EURO|nr:hypothetical protein ARAM_006903 [Aspergillus rambellii]